MRSYWASIRVRIFAATAVLLVALLTVRLLPAIEHYQCSKRDEARAEVVWRLIAATLKEEESTRTDVRQFIEKNFAALPILESETEISAGRMIFSFDQGGILTESLQEVGCPIG